MKLPSLARSATALAVAVLALGAGVSRTHAQDQPLGPFHMWISVGQQYFHDDVEEFWGVRDDTFVALEGYGSLEGRHYMGGRIGYLGVGEAGVEGEFTITDFTFLTGEVNYKYAVDLGHGFVFDVGGGGAFLWIDAVEEDFSDLPLNDAAFGYQVFFDLTYRARRFLAGLDARYQRAFDIVDLNTSSFSAGAHVGVVF